jgi:sec-independent protein translocase protein TatB
MFDIGFSELILIAIVTLLVVGPERMPKVARTAGHLFGRLQRYVSEVKADINRELKLEELRKLEADMREKARDMEHSMTDEINRASQELKQTADVVQSLPEAAQPAPEAVQQPAENKPMTVSPQLELGLDSAPAKPEKTA